MDFDYFSHKNYNNRKLKNDESIVYDVIGRVLVDIPLFAVSLSDANISPWGVYILYISASLVPGVKVAHVALKTPICGPNWARSKVRACQHFM